MPLSNSEKVRRFYHQFAGEDHVLIVINADPDALASAMAVKRLLWRKTAGTQIAAINVITRPDNLAMVRLLGIKMVHLDTVDQSRFSRVVMVDSQPAHHRSLAALDPHVVIDHHPETGCQPLFGDIRPRYGATASIMAEYLRAAKIKPSAKLATGLYHAIKTDTSNFERQTSGEDVRAFQFLFRHANLGLARKIEQADLRLDFLKYFRDALENMCLRRGKVFVHLGTVMTPDVCVLVADFFMRVNPVSWSIVSGVFDDKLVLIFRNDGLRKNAGKLASRCFGIYGSAGGHKSMARAELALENIEADIAAGNRRSILRWIIDRIEGNGGTP